MCGIVGYIGPKNATPIIMNGLKKLEYRGYDSAGIAVLENGNIEVRRDAGKLERLSHLVQQSPSYYVFLIRSLLHMVFHVIDKQNHIFLQLSEEFP
jgi:glucosamine 6-phosphate synthetase-like amidotransferase/phosphosugar isomerase protein